MRDPNDKKDESDVDKEVVEENFDDYPFDEPLDFNKTPRNQYEKDRPWYDF